MLIGLTGGSGSGKSTAAQMFKEYNALVIDADIIAREVVEPGSPALAEIAKTFGNDVLLPDGSLDRRKLGGIVFSDKLKLLMLNKITHKYITEKIMNIIAMDGQKHSLVVLDAAILFESGMAEKCDITIAITAPEDIRIERICVRDGISHQDAQKRITAQMPQSEMVSRADFTVDTADGADELRRMVERIAQYKI